MSKPASGGNPYLNLGALAVVVVALCFLPMLTSPYYIRIATGIALWAGIALSWNVICGYAGYISFGHVAFFGIGSYATAILMQPDYDWNFWATLPVAAVAAGAVAALVGWPALRLKGAYFAIATWALAEAVRELATVVDVTGGSGGLKTPIRLDDNFFFYLMLVTTAIAYAVCYLLLERSRFGFRVKAVRDNEVAARAQGINTNLVKIEAFVLSAVIPAVLGGINAYWITFINPNSVLNTIITDQIVVMVLVGGLGHIWGPALGATAMFLMQEQLRVSYGETTAYIIVVGAIVMAVVLFLPDGLVSLARRARRMRLVRQLLGRAARRRHTDTDRETDRGGHTMTVLAVDEHRPRLRRHPRGRRGDVRRRAGRDRRHHRAQRQRQEHAVQPADRHAQARRGHHHVVRQEHHQAAVVQDRTRRPRPHFPDPRVVRQHDCAGEPLDRRRAVRLEQRHRTRRRRAGAAGAHPGRRRPRQQPLGWAAAAAGDGPHPDAGAQGCAARRSRRGRAPAAAPDHARRRSARCATRARRS